MRALPELTFCPWSLGVLIIAAGGNAVDLMHVLFATCFCHRRYFACCSSADCPGKPLLALAGVYRPLIWSNASIPASCAHRAAAARWVHQLFSGAAGAQPRERFPALGTLMALGPHGAARHRRALLDGKHRRRRDARIASSFAASLRACCCPII